MTIEINQENIINLQIAEKGNNSTKIIIGKQNKYINKIDNKRKALDCLTDFRQFGSDIPQFTQERRDSLINCKFRVT